MELIYNSVQVKLEWKSKNASNSVIIKEISIKIVGRVFIFIN